jgi:hypothetical protein
MILVFFILTRLFVNKGSQKTEWRWLIFVMFQGGARLPEGKWPHPAGGPGIPIFTVTFAPK